MTCGCAHQDITLYVDTRFLECRGRILATLLMPFVAFAPPGKERTKMLLPQPASKSDTWDVGVLALILIASSNPLPQTTLVPSYTLLSTTHCLVPCLMLSHSLSRTTLSGPHTHTVDVSSSSRTSSHDSCNSHAISLTSRLLKAEVKS